MQLNEIETYLNKLEKQLVTYGIKSNQKIIENIRFQIYSMLAVWNDKETRNGILLPSFEIAEHYMLNTNINTKAFVATTIRNSILESAGSKYYYNYNFESRLSDENIKTITTEAIKYFKNISLENLSNKLKDYKKNNYYLETIQKYPLSWEIIKMAGNTKKLEFHFTPIKINKNKLTEIFPDNKNYKEDDGVVIEDGMTLSYNKVLCEVLETCAKYPEIPFFTDSFKFLSRNFEKVLKTFEYLLERNCKYVTFNYYISNGYISRRKELLKPSHGEKEVKQKFKNMKGVTSKHKGAIETIKKLNSECL